MTANILIVDDEQDIRRLIRGILEDEGYTAREAQTASEAHRLIEETPPQLLVLDIWLEGSEQDGLGILAQVRETHPDMPVIMISGHGTIETAVSAIKSGAYDFIEKPFKTDRLLLMVDRALEAARLKKENTELKKQAAQSNVMIGDSPAMRAARQLIGRIAPSKSRVLITGEAGTGKNLAARMIHDLSERAHAPFLTVNCAALHPERIEEELFGCEDTARGVVTPGVLEQACGGTLFLDEVADMKLETQGKIIRVLQEQTFHRIGGSQPVSFDVRILASSNRDLASLIDQGKFREDLFYRLNVVPLEMPALRDRLRDIPALVAHFTELNAARAGQPGLVFSQDALTLMQGQRWPGNIRQLRNVVEWVMIMADNTETEITPAQLPPDIRGAQSAPPAGLEGAGGAAICIDSMIACSLKQARNSFEAEYLRRQLERFEGNISKTAAFIGMERSALHRKLKSLDIFTGAKQDKESDEAAGQAGQATGSALRKRA